MKQATLPHLKLFDRVRVKRVPEQPHTILDVDFKNKRLLLGNNIKGCPSLWFPFDEIQGPWESNLEKFINEE